MRVSFLFTGIFATFAFAWYAQTILPQSQLGNLQPQVDEESGDIYPINNQGIVAQGRKVYVSNGCMYCHTQQVRADDGGSDIERGWGKRRTVARDYIFDDPVVLGVTRNGPDLANEGLRQIDGKPAPAAWYFEHLYNPRSKSEDSIMPAFRHLFVKRKISGEPSVDALKGVDAGEDYEIVPTSEAKALVAYLMSLDRSHPLKEVKQEAPAK
jgi:cytochrome c oxidase cbb3-type subunit 2